jgi:hypothetical protein
MAAGVRCLPDASEKHGRGPIVLALAPRAVLQQVDVIVAPRG